MDQPNTICGMPCFPLPDGRLLPALRGAGGGPDVPPPDPGITSKQNQLMELQLQNARRSQQLEPLLLREAGLRYNEKTGQYEDLDPSLANNKREIERMQTERSLKALKGELPVSKTLQREFEVGQQQLNEQLNRQLGPGYALSTSGIQKQEAFDRNRIALQEAEQRDMLTTAEALALNRQNARSTSAAQFENPFAAQARALAPAQASVRDAREADNFTRNMQYQSNVAAGQDRAGYISAGLGLASMGGAMYMLSDPEAKTDIEPVSDAALLAGIRKMPVSRWKYKHDGTEHIGAMADVMPEDVSNGKVVDVVSYLGLLTGSIRELDRKIRELDGELSPGMALAV